MKFRRIHDDAAKELPLYMKESGSMQQRPCGISQMSEQMQNFGNICNVISFRKRHSRARNQQLSTFSLHLQEFA